MVSVNPYIYPKMSFDPIKDLEPVAAAARVLVFQTSPLPGQGRQGVPGSFGPGRASCPFASRQWQPPHLAAEMMKSQANVFATHVPYRAAPALTDLLAGQLDFLFDPGGDPADQGRQAQDPGGRQPHALTLFPDVPTLDEIGLKGFDATVFGLCRAGRRRPTSAGSIEVARAGPTRSHRSPRWRAGADDARQFHAKALEDGQRRQADSRAKDPGD
jgi:hypothetical protein